MVIGPRGSGKTHLLLRVAAEVRRDPSLSGFYPIVFAEESYEVFTIGEFWLECLDHLTEQAPEGERANLRLSYDDLRSTGDDRALADRCLGTILDFADRHGKRVVLLVENLNMLFADMDDPDAGWRLRHTLQTEPRIVLLGSATSRFDEIDHPDHALYDLFRVITLRSPGYTRMRGPVGGGQWTTVHNPGGQTSGDPHRRQSQAARHHCPFQLWQVVSRAEGQSVGPGGRPHGVFQEPLGIIAGAGAPGLPLLGQVVETCNRQRGC